jgi:hypothetical protein
VTFEVEGGVYAPGPVIPGFTAVRRTSSGSDIVIVRFIRPTAIHTGPDATVDATTAAAAVEALQGNAALVDLGSSESRMSGLTGLAIELEAAAADSPKVMLRGTISFVLEPGLRAWIAFFDTPRVGRAAPGVGDHRPVGSAAWLSKERSSPPGSPCPIRRLRATPAS